VRQGSSWTAGRVIGTILATVGGLIGLALLIGGIAVLAAYAFGRDDDGYFTSDRETLETSGFAIATDDIDLGVDAADWAPDEILGDVRIRAEGVEPIFVGIGSDVDVGQYLGGVAYDELIDFEGGEPQLESQQGGPPSGPPGDEDFWVAQVEGAGEQTLNWDADFGRFTALVVNADGSRGVTVEADAGLKLDWAVWAGLGMFVVGLVISLGAVAIILLIGRRASRDPLAAG
jgi:hypothetical protein